MTPLEYKRATGKAPPFEVKLASVTSLEELEGFERRARADGKVNGRVSAAIEKRRVQLSKGARR